jgi:diaminopimelate epimerase
MHVSKYSASGNDFVIYHSFKKIDRSNIAKKLCDRFNGIGADGLIVLLPHSKYDFEWQFYNADGSEAEMCGNGSRAAAHYAYINNLADKKMKFLTLAGVIEAEVDGDIVTSQLTPYELVKDTFYEEGYEWKIYNTGVPHLVAVTDINNFDKKLAKKMREKYNANVNFAQLKDDTVYVRTYERGVEDETLACGTGMCASFLVLRDLGLVKNHAKLKPKSNEDLEVMLKNETLYFKGRVKNTFNAVLKENERDLL